MKRDPQISPWQSRLILLLVTPVVGTYVFLSIISPGKPHGYALGISTFFAVAVGTLRAATPGAALLGGLLTASLIYSTSIIPFQWFSSELSPLLVLFLLTFAATRFGKRTKEHLAIAESSRGRNAAQIAANLGVAGLAAIPMWGPALLAFHPELNSSIGAVASLAALIESTADTLSSELGQVIGGQPRMITNLRKVPAGTDGAISLAGTMAGLAGASIVAFVGAYALQFRFEAMLIAFAGGILGFFIDSLLGATLELRHWLNNDAVNFLSTLAAAVTAVAIALLA